MVVDSVILASTQRLQQKGDSSVPAWGYSVKQWGTGEGGGAPCTFSRSLMEGLLYLGPDIF